MNGCVVLANPGRGLLRMHLKLSPLDMQASFKENCRVGDAPIKAFYCPFMFLTP